MDRLTKYPEAAWMLGEFFNSPPENLVVAGFLCSAVVVMRVTLYYFVNHQANDLPYIFDPPTVMYLKNMGIFTPYGDYKTYVGAQNWITPEVINRLKDELALGDAFLSMDNLDILISDNHIPLQDLITQLGLLFPL